MKKILVIASLFAIGMLVILPSISAIEVNTSVDVNKTSMLTKIRNIRSRIKGLDVKGLILGLPFLILVFILLWAKGTTAGNPFGFPACPFVIPPP
jgi:hypothetical protein